MCWKMRPNPTYGWTQPMSISVPQGSFLGPLTFIILVDGMTAGDFTHKYIDDNTLTELIPKQAISRMQLVVDDLAFQAIQCHMNINGKKLCYSLLQTDRATRRFSRIFANCCTTAYEQLVRQ